MKSRILLAACMLAIAAMAVPASADRYQRGSSDNPFRLVAYALHPVGILIEYSIMRPVHWVVSQPNLDIIFGHQSTPHEDGTYFEWVHGDYSPSIAEERRRAEAAAQAEE